MSSPNGLNWEFHEKEYTAIELHDLLAEQGFSNILIYGQKITSIGKMRSEFIEDIRENFLGENMLDQHFADIGFAHRRVDGALGLRQKRIRRQPERSILRIGRVNAGAQRLQHGGKIDGELRDCLPEIGDFRALISEEQADEMIEPRLVAHAAACDLAAALNEHRRFGILEDDIVLRIALGEFAADFLVEVVSRVLGFPPAVRNAEIVEDGSVRDSPVLLRRIIFKLADKGQPLLLGPVLQQILEGLADDAFID